MKLLADLHIAPRTVEFLQTLGHDVSRMSVELEPSASDVEIVEHARREGQIVLSQDLDFTKIVRYPGFASLRARLCSYRAEDSPALM